MGGPLGRQVGERVNEQTMGAVHRGRPFPSADIERLAVRIIVRGLSPARPLPPDRRERHAATLERWPVLPP